MLAAGEHHVHHLGLGRPAARPTSPDTGVRRVVAVPRVGEGDPGFVARRSSSEKASVLPTVACQVNLQTDE